MSRRAAWTLIAACAWTVWVWLTFMWIIGHQDHPMGFKVVHGLIAVGSIVVFVADHFVRPVLIGGSTRLPFVWVLLGILGGVESFGLLGLLLGPALLAVLIALWREIAAPEMMPVQANTETRPR